MLTSPQGQIITRAVTKVCQMKSCQAEQGMQKKRVLKPDPWDDVAPAMFYGLRYAQASACDTCPMMKQSKIAYGGLGEDIWSIGCIRRNASEGTGCQIDGP
jgi:hypothetical protein